MRSDIKLHVHAIPFGRTCCSLSTSTLWQQGNKKDAIQSPVDFLRWYFLKKQDTVSRVKLTLISTIVREVFADDFHVLNACNASSDCVVENVAESRLSRGMLSSLVDDVVIERL